MLRTLKDKLKFSLSLAPAVISATGASTGFNVNDFGSLSFAVLVGVAATNDFSATHKLDIVLQHSDVDVDGSYSDCADADIYNAEVGASGIVKALDASADSSNLYMAHYRGNKKFARIRLVETGTVSCPVGIMAIGGHSELQPPL